MTILFDVFDAIFRFVFIPGAFVALLTAFSITFNPFRKPATNTVEQVDSEEITLKRINEQRTQATNILDTDEFWTGYAFLEDQVELPRAS